MIACFDLKIGFFQQTVVRVYYILNMLYHDGSAKFIYQSKSKKFQMRNIFLPQNRAVSTASKRIFDCALSFGSVYLIVIRLLFI